MKNVILFCLFCLSLGLATSCSKSETEPTNGNLFPIEPENLPMFQFDEQGVPYRWETPTLSQEMQQDVQKQAIGYGWKWMQTHEIKSDGYVDPNGFYDHMVGGGPESYYFESNDKVISYFFSDAIPAMAFRAYKPTMDLTKGILADVNNTSSSVYRWSLFIRIWSVWQLDGKWYMTTVEPLGVQNDGHGGEKTVWACSQYVRMNQEELKQMQDRYTYDCTPKK